MACPQGRNRVPTPTSTLSIRRTPEWRPSPRSWRRRFRPRTGLRPRTILQPSAPTWTARIRYGFRIWWPRSACAKTKESLVLSGVQTRTITNPPTNTKITQTKTFVSASIPRRRRWAVSANSPASLLRALGSPYLLEPLTFRSPTGVQFRRGVAMNDSIRSSRRRLLQMGAALGGGLLANRDRALAADNTPGQLGAPLGPYGERSPFEKAVRWRRDSKTPETGSSFTPLQDSVGSVTPSSLHYERHHAGIPTIDPALHRLVIHGMVDRPLSLTVAEIRRLLSVSRTLVLECGGTAEVNGSPRQRPTCSAAMAWPVAVSGPASRCRCCSWRPVSNLARRG